MSYTDGKLVSKEWNGFGFKRIVKSDYTAVISHLQQHFYPDEPMKKILGNPEDRIADNGRNIQDVLNLNHGSYLAFPLDQPNKIASVLIILLRQKGKNLPAYQPHSPSTKIVGNVLRLSSQKYNIHEERGIDVYPEVYIISTDKKFRGKGLATQMFRIVIEELKSQGHVLVSSTFTNPLSRKVGEKLGFKEVSRLNFDECKHEDGSLVFGETGNGHFVMEAVLDLQ